ncbi:MAG TPA: hypothetical protein VI895_11410 [Bdellovibrionota bacterium]|nr:hypothetical protein [Bdellovibrionota bacterium]
MFAIGCSGPGSEVSSAPTPADDPHQPLELADVISHPSPFALYANAYGAFQFSSHSKLTLGDREKGEQIEGRSFLERDERGNYHFIRAPLSSESPVEAIYVDGKVYLRLGKGSDFTAVRHQMEFDRWANRALREVFSLYENGFLSEASNSSSREKLTCWATKYASVCVDPATGLPLEGTFRPKAADSGPQKNISNLEVRYSISPATHRKFSIVPPLSGKKAAR